MQESHFVQSAYGLHLLESIQCQLISEVSRMLHRVPCLFPEFLIWQISPGLQAYVCTSQHRDTGGAAITSLCYNAGMSNPEAISLCMCTLFSRHRSGHRQGGQQGSNKGAQQPLTLLQTWCVEKQASQTRRVW